ncbi:STAS domain-containing protein [Sporosarcina aquimarina]|uniref:STAS domain-containing protein n=1 Tax=Sporosarcina aquimarina TaxID=114975 RepID=A0ABU4FXF0_9BACL|nr:STAS domain-containing protein [Sporosarcina aquimarina]MDW0108758.1 STAS domain-containing protein [Sporosarcina aquimarina]
MKRVDDFIEYINVHKDKLAQDVIDRVCVQFKDPASEEEKDKALLTYIDLWGFLADSLEQEDVKAPDRLVEWSIGNAEMQARKKHRISVVVNRYPPTRDVFADMLYEICTELDMHLKEYVNINKLINRLLDISLSETFLAYEQLTDRYRDEAERELIKLLAPIVPVQDGIVILPFIGKITDDRAEAILDTILPKIAKLHVETVILDFSGLWSIDERVARSLQQIEGALSLMGIEVYITGLRPELAQTIVNSGSALVGKGYFITVKQALEQLN